MRELGKNLLDQRNIIIVEKNVFLTVRQGVTILPIILSWYEHYFGIIQKIIKLTTSIVSLQIKRRPARKSKNRQLRDLP